MSPIISPNDLLSLDPATYILIDARSGKDAKATFEKEHLKGALFADLESDLADIKADVADGGRHPLPTPGAFSKVLSRLGISKESRVIIYDDKNGANAAARMWWMVKAAGVASVQVVDGGYQAAARAGFPTDQEIKEIASTQFSFDEWQLPVADIVEVAKAAKDECSVVIDVREKGRYDGAFEPIDLVAGHIPGAINIPFTENLSTDGKFLSCEALQEKYDPIADEFDSENIIVHCGSGVTACHTLLAFEAAGLPMPKLYVGSWSEWSRNDRPLATAESESGTGS